MRWPFVRRASAVSFVLIAVVAVAAPPEPAGSPRRDRLQSGTLAPDIRLKQGLLSMLPTGSLEVGNLAMREWIGCGR